MAYGSDHLYLKVSLLYAWSMSPPFFLFPITNPWKTSFLFLWTLMIVADGTLALIICYFKEVNGIEEWVSLKHNPSLIIFFMAWTASLVFYVFSFCIECYRQLYHHSLLLVSAWFEGNLKSIPLLFCSCSI